MKADELQRGAAATMRDRASRRADTLYLRVISEFDVRVGWKGGKQKLVSRMIDCTCRGKCKESEYGERRMSEITLSVMEYYEENDESE
jgi:hypothetical protein